jgi:hypothetical protein
MDILYVLIVLIAFAVVMYCINTFIQLDPKLKQLVNVVALVLFIIWIFWYSGLFYHHAVIIR